MCGICGFTGDPAPDIIAKMNATLVHRGPDEAGEKSLPGVTLAMRRLSIVDLAGGHQPISNESETVWTVFNGEIYNFRLLRRELQDRGHVFRSNHSDTELVVHLYEDEGKDWVHRVNAMFGVAVWDSERRRLLLYRDRIGKKPLYYAMVGKNIVFGSEIKAVLAHPGVSRELDRTALYSYFGLKNISAPATAYRQVRQLMPGEVLVWQDGNCSFSRYWRVDMHDVHEDITAEEAAGTLLNLLDDAVRLRMDCDAPYGAYLSGGVDSSSVVTVMNRYHKSGLKTFCLAYDEPAKGQFAGKTMDRGFAQRVANDLDSEHYEKILAPDEFAAGMDDVQRAFDEPFSGTCSTYFLTGLIREHVKVALSGDGADELFGSYYAHRLAFPLEALAEMLRSGKDGWSDLNEQDRARLRPFDSEEGFARLRRLQGCDLLEWRNRLCVFSHEERQRLLHPDLLHQDKEAGRLADRSYREIHQTLTGQDALNRVLEWDQRELLPNQVLPFVDRLSMAHSVEVRCPYMDYRIIEFANRLPGRLKIHDGIVKYVHKLAMQSLLPAELLDRPKEGFVQPNYTWIHGPLRNWANEQLDALPTSFVNPRFVQELRARNEPGNDAWNAKIWNLICFSVWYRACKP